MNVAIGAQASISGHMGKKKGKKVVDKGGKVDKQSKQAFKQEDGLICLGHKHRSRHNHCFQSFLKKSFPEASGRIIFINFL